MSWRSYDTPCAACGGRCRTVACGRSWSSSDAGSSGRLVFVRSRCFCARCLGADRTRTRLGWSNASNFSLVAVTRGRSASQTLGLSDKLRTLRSGPTRGSHSTPPASSPIHPTTATSCCNDGVPGEHRRQCGHHARRNPEPTGRRLDVHDRRPLRQERRPLFWNTSATWDHNRDAGIDAPAIYASAGLGNTWADTERQQFARPPTT